MPVVASATLEVTPVLSGAQQSLTEQLSGAAVPAADKAGEESGGILSSSLAKGIAKGSAVVAGAVAAVGGALVGTAAKTAEYGDQIDKASQKLGVSSTFYQEWEAVLQHSGTSMGSMTASFKKLATASQDASKDQVAAFEAIGLSMDQVKSMSTEELFTNVISGLQGMEEGTERTALATELLGKGAMEMGALLNTSAEDTQGMIDRVHELGGVMDEAAVNDAAAFQDSLQDMKASFTGIRNSLASGLMPVLSGFMDKVGDFVANADLSPLTDMFSGAFDAVAEFVSSLDIEAIGETFQSVMSGIGDAVSTAWDVIQTVFTSITDGLSVITDSLGETDVSWSDVWGEISSIISSAAEVVSQAISVISQAIAWLVTQAQTEGTVFNAIWKNIQIAVQTARDVIKGVIQFVSALLKGDWKGAWESARGVVSTIWSSIRSMLSNYWNSIRSTASNIWNGIKSAITTPIQNAKNTISGILSTIRGFFPISIGNIFSNLKLPHISISGGEAPFGIGGKGSLPHFSVNWYAKAMENPYMFQNATLFGAGETGDEILYGKDALLRDIREAVGNDPKIVNYFTVNGAEDPEAWASKFARQMKLEMRMA